MAIIKPVINTKQRFGLGLKDRAARVFSGWPREDQTGDTSGAGQAC